jgi:hypothetical protein
MTNAIVACARGWIGTRFQHQGRLKKSGTHKGGVDCLGLLIGVAVELKLKGRNNQLLAEADETFYPHYPDVRKLEARLGELLEPVGPGCIAAGDVLLISVDRSPQHLAIVSDMQQGLGIIHAYAPARSVVEHYLDKWWRERIKAIFKVV